MASDSEHASGVLPGRKTVFITGFSVGTTDDDVRSLLEPYGSRLMSKMVPHSNASDGVRCALVKFMTPSAATECIRDLNKPPLSAQFTHEEERPSDPERDTLFIRTLPANIPDDHVVNLLKPYGTVLRITHFGSGVTTSAQPTGRLEVVFGSIEEASAALCAINDGAIMREFRVIASFQRPRVSTNAHRTTSQSETIQATQHPILPRAPKHTGEHMGQMLPPQNLGTTHTQHMHTFSVMMPQPMYAMPCPSPMQGQAQPFMHPIPMYQPTTTTTVVAAPAAPTAVPSPGDLLFYGGVSVDDVGKLLCAVGQPVVQYCVPAAFGNGMSGFVVRLPRPADHPHVQQRLHGVLLPNGHAPGVGISTSAHS